MHCRWRRCISYLRVKPPHSRSTEEDIIINRIVNEFGLSRSSLQGHWGHGGVSPLGLTHCLDRAAPWQGHSCKHQVPSRRLSEVPDIEPLGARS